MQPILDDKLYVPEHLVDGHSLGRDQLLGRFVHQVVDRDQARLFGGSGDQAKIDVRTFNKIQGLDGIYYGFSRGDLGKLGELFGHLDWIDRTAAPGFETDLQFTGQLYTYEEKRRGQIEAATEWLRGLHGIIRAAPRFGKTVVSIYLLARLRVKTLIVAHQQDLIDQFYQTFLEFSNYRDLVVPTKQKKRDATGRGVGFFSDYDNPERLDVTLLCWQKFASKYGAERLDQYRAAWGLVICDEVHKAGAFKYAGVINNLAARYRLGLTGTLERTDGQEQLVRDIVGPVVVDGLVDQVPCRVVAIHTGLRVDFAKGEPIPRVLQRLAALPERNDLLIEHLTADCRAGHYICLAYHGASTDQLDQFTSLLQERGFKAEAFYGTMRRNRKQVLNLMRSGDVQVAVCNGRMLTGIDVPRWDMYYSAFPSANVVINDQGKLSGNHYQEFSRIRTPFTYEDGRIKTLGIIKDFVDVVPYCFATYKKRLKAYQNQGFEIETVTVKRNLVINKEM
jgi:hypothetical protein